MKHYLTLIAFFIISLSSTAHKLSEQDVNEKTNLAVLMHSEQVGYENLNVMISYKSVDEFADRIRIVSEKALKWAKVANRNDVKNFRKPITGTIDYDHLSFHFDGCENVSQGYFMVPSFDVDRDGECYLLLRGYYKGFNVTTRNITRIKGDKNRYQQMAEFNFFLRINTNELEAWLDELDQMAVQVKQTQKQKRKMKKLFK